MYHCIACYREHSQILYDILLISETIFHRLYPLFTILVVAPRGVAKSLRGCEKSILYKILHRIKKKSNFFFSSKKKQLKKQKKNLKSYVAKLEKEMRNHASDLEFEEAAKIRDKIKKIKLSIITMALLSVVVSTQLMLIKKSFLAYLNLFERSIRKKNQLLVYAAVVSPLLSHLAERWV